MGKIYVCGGSGKTILKSCESYDPQTNQWSTIESMQSKRSLFKLIAIDDSLYALGGYSDDGGLLDSVELYDYKSDKWLYTTSLPQKIDIFGATVL
ncbi:kelch-like protein 18 [Oppia nitens]|uniref:kelch-like protein 18 n=1 Tax=Oppia nitens TaxID=1686743 RepID=UPI0023DC7B94|nr:kelch-like protein 18 [Oppia nitens]